MPSPRSPLISVLTPFYNAATTLLPAVQSVLAQTYQNWELVLVDDGSTDGSLALAQALADPRIRVVSDGVNRGHAHRRNQLLGLARGEFVAWLDADDLIHSRRLEKLLAAFEEDPSLDVVASGVAALTPDYRVAGVRELAPLRASALDFLLRGGVVHSSLMARRDWYRRFPYREGYHRAEDRELLLRAFPHTRFGKICEPLYFYMESGVQSEVKLQGSYRSERRTLMEYGPRHVGRLASLRLWLRSWAKSAVVWLLSRLNRLEWLARGRITEADAVLQRELQDEVGRILAQPLPCAAAGADGR